MILDDSSIAKGIRRVTGVTGEEALKAQNVAEDMQRRITELKSEDITTLELQLKVIGKELDECVMPIISRTDLKTQFNAIKKDFIDADKARKAEEVKEAVELVKQHFEANPSDQIYVKILPTSSSKALSQAILSIKGMQEKTAFLFAKEDGKVLMQCVVAKCHIEKGLKAQEWAGEVATLLGGKCGGKDDSAQGSGVNSEMMDDAVALALEFVQKLKL